jgi:hypothetical protein
MKTTMTTTKDIAPLPLPLPIEIVVSPVVTGLDEATRRTLEMLARSVAPGYCDAIGESGHRCTLRAGHPGEIHEHCEYGRVWRYRLTGEAWRADR